MPYNAGDPDEPFYNPAGFPNPPGRGKKLFYKVVKCLVWAILAILAICVLVTLARQDDFDFFFGYISPF